MSDALLKTTTKQSRTFWSLIDFRGLWTRQPAPTGCDTRQDDLFYSTNHHVKPTQIKSGEWVWERTKVEVSDSTTKRRSSVNAILRPTGQDWSRKINVRVMAKPKPDHYIVSQLFTRVIIAHLLKEAEVTFFRVPTTNIVHHQSAIFQEIVADLVRGRTVIEFVEVDPGAFPNKVHFLQRVIHQLRLHALTNVGQRAVLQYIIQGIRYGINRVKQRGCLVCWPVLNWRHDLLVYVTGIRARAQRTFEDRGESLSEKRVYGPGA